MKKYRSVYSFNVMDEIKVGKFVDMLDRKNKEVVCVNDIEVGEFAKVLESAGEEKDRFEFWVEEESEAE